MILLAALVIGTIALYVKEGLEHDALSERI